MNVLKWLLFAIVCAASAVKVHALGLDIRWTDSATGEVYFGGGDLFDAPRPPGWNGFHWNFGDGESLVGFFGQFHVYDDLTRSYTASVTSHYANGTSDTKSVPVSFLPAPTLRVSGLTPAPVVTTQGPVEVTISGSGFVNGAAVEFWPTYRTGERSVTNVQYVDSNTLKGLFDPTGLPSGPWDVTVINPNKEAASFRTEFSGPKPSTLFMSVGWANSTTGEVFFTGADRFDAPRPPGWNGFAWNFGDGQSLDHGYFPQFHLYDDLTATYTASVASQYADLTIDTKSALVDFPLAPTMSVNGLSPLGINAAQDPVEITISGSGFVNGAAAEFRTPDRIGWRPVTNIQNVDANTLKGTLDPAGLIAGPWDLIVFNPNLEAASFRTGVFFPGDYNRDGAVDAADYIVWRDTLGESGVSLAADGDNSGTIDDGDYALWRSYFGHTVGSAVSVPMTVPEPPAVGLLLAAVHAVAIVYCYRRR